MEIVWLITIDVGIDGQHATCSIGTVGTGGEGWVGMFSGFREQVSEEACAFLGHLHPFFLLMKPACWPSRAQYIEEILARLDEVATPQTLAVLRSNPWNEALAREAAAIHCAFYATGNAAMAREILADKDFQEAWIARIAELVGAAQSSEA